MATELVSLNAGDLTVVNRGRIGGIVFRDVMPSALVDELEPANALGPAHMEFMEDLVGRYPFASYGTLSADSNAGFALENQTLSLYPAWFLIQAPPAAYEPIMVHELAHQWFGDSVAPFRWRDVWLNEGHATWYEQLYAAEKYPEFYDFEAAIREYYSHGDEWRTQYGPVAAPFSATDILDLFNPNVYQGGATALYALRQVVGDRTFYEIERRWVRRYEGESASTDDFIALASRVAHRNLGPFLRDWLYGSKTPPMPGHPDWTVNPPAAAPAAPKAGKSRRPASSSAWPSADQRNCGRIVSAQVVKNASWSGPTCCTNSSSTPGVRVLAQRAAWASRSGPIGELRVLGRDELARLLEVRRRRQDLRELARQRLVRPQPEHGLPGLLLGVHEAHLRARVDRALAAAERYCSIASLSGGVVTKPSPSSAASAIAFGPKPEISTGGGSSGRS